MHGACSAPLAQVLGVNGSAADLFLPLRAYHCPPPAPLFPCSAKKRAMKLYMQRRLGKRLNRGSVAPDTALRQLNSALFPSQRRFFSDAAELSGTLDAEAEADPGSWPDEYADEYDEKDGGGGLGFGAATMSEAAFEKKLWPAGIEPPKRIGSRTPGTLPRVAKKSGVYDPIVHG